MGKAFFLRSVDPGFLALRRSLKTFAAILISLVVFRDNPGMGMFAAISSLLFSRSQVGLTIGERKFSMVVTGLATALLSVPVSLISQNRLATVVYVIVGAFVTFFLIGRRIVPDFPAISVLALSVVELAFSHTVRSGVHFAGLFLLSTVLVYFVHFIIWPTRPSRRINAQLEMIRGSMKAYFDAVTKSYPDLDTGIEYTRQKAAEVRSHLAGFRRLWRLFRVDADLPSPLKAHHRQVQAGLEKVFEYLLLFWQFRARTWDSALFRNQILTSQLFPKCFNRIMQRYHPDPERSTAVPAEQVYEELQALDRNLLQLYQDGETPATREEWVAVFNTVKALEVMMDPVQSGTAPAPDSSPGAGEASFSVRQRLDESWLNLRESVAALGFGHAAFRLGLRSAVIIGLTEIYARYFEPLYGYWLVLFAVLLIRPNLGISIRAGRDRLVGTVAGALPALVFVAYVPVPGVWFFAAVLLSLFLMIWFANLDRFVPMVVSLTFMIICLFTLIHPGEGNLALLRIAYTLAIVLLVIFLSFVLWPERARRRFAGALADVLLAGQKYFLHTINGLTHPQGTAEASSRREMEAALMALDEVIGAVKNEVLLLRTINHGLAIRGLLCRLFNTLHALEVAGENSHFSGVFDPLQEHLGQFAGRAGEAFLSLAAALEQRGLPEGYPDLHSAFDSLRENFRYLKALQEHDEPGIRQFWNNSTLIWNLKPLVDELDGIRHEIILKMSESA